MIAGIVRVLARMNGAVGTLVQRIAATLLVVMLVVVVAQVVFRYGLNSPISWAEELSKTLMVWSAFLIAPYAYREGINVSIDLFKDSWPPLLRRISELLIALLVAWIVMVLFLESLPLVVRGMKVSAASLPVPTGVFYGILPVSFAALLLAIVERLLIILTEFVEPPKPEGAEST